ncbi:IRF tryptophan pentad repeat domain-containing protein [Caerostris darwini]|uniref:IRF tryptophan pentad repeat domain-containing protein n=1 Tax=Caerostris darwini TaxID=1538125 RepID=A0AAV4QQS7_9ARAC|nr:IRF tryptophan pentad repeat domain-containing protein [Caerostris darwini]
MLSLNYSVPQNRKKYNTKMDEPHQRTRLLQDFLIPHLNNKTFGAKLYWTDASEGKFRILWKHQSSSRFEAEDSAVYREWAIKKGLWDPRNPRAPTIAKQRFRAALLKLRHVTILRKEHDYRDYKIDLTLGQGNQFPANDDYLESDAFIEEILRANLQNGFHG